MPQDWEIAWPEQFNPVCNHLLPSLSCRMLIIIIEGNKSTGQKMGDTVRGGSDDASNEGKSLMDSATDTFNSVTGQKK